MTNLVFLIFLKERVKSSKGLSQFCIFTVTLRQFYMDDFPRMLYGWSWEENKAFELALAVVDEEKPDRWEVVAAMVGGKKSAEDVQKHYVFLLEDLKCIESGELDHTIAGEAQPFVQVDCTHSVCWTDEDHKLLVQLDIN